MDSFFSVTLSSLFLLYIPLFTSVSYWAINYLVYSRRVAQWKRSNIPFLKPSFLIGHKYFLNLTKDPFVALLDRIYKENSDKDVVGFFMATVPMVMIRNPAIIKQVFTSNYKKMFKKAFIGSSNDEFAQYLLALTTDKDRWKSNRRMVSPMFTTFRSGEAFNNLSTQIDRLRAHAEGVYRAGSPLDVKKITINALVDGLSNSAFSLDANSYEKQGDLYKLFTAKYNPGFMNVIRVYAQMQFPGAHMFDSLRILGKRYLDLMRNILRQQIERRKQYPRDGNDFVDFWMSLKNGEGDGQKGPDIDISNEMIGLAFTAAFGGTTLNNLITLMTMSIHHLSLHPEHQERIRQEVADVMRKHQTSEFTHEVARDLPFTEQCLLETLRLFPGLLFQTRLCSEDFKLSSANYTFKKGELVIINPYSVHRDPQNFKNPDQFDPERFSPENRKAISPDSFLSYGIGPRKCPGDKLSLFWVGTMVASLVHKFEIRPRSHQKQITLTDIAPKFFGVLLRDKMLVDVIPRDIMARE